LALERGTSIARKGILPWPEKVDIVGGKKRAMTDKENTIDGQWRGKGRAWGGGKKKKKEKSFVDEVPNAEWVGSCTNRVGDSALGEETRWGNHRWEHDTKRIRANTAGS